jgi:hypothetical protein
MPSSMVGPSGSIYGEPVTLHASQARTSTGSGAAVFTKDAGVVRLLLDVTAASGTTPSMTVTLEQSRDGSTWRTVSSFAAKTTTGQEALSAGGLDRYIRVSWTISGTTPSFTFSVSGELVGP